MSTMAVQSPPVQDTAPTVETPGSAENSHEQMKDCKLLELPGELRNRIYSYATTTSGAVVVYPGRAPLKLPPLRQTCSQIARELKPIYVAENTFIFTDNALTPETIARLKRLMGKSVEKVGAVKVMRKLRKQGILRWLRFRATAADDSIRVEPLSGVAIGYDAEDGLDYIAQESFHKHARAELCDCQLRALAKDCDNVMEFVERFVEALFRLHDVLEWTSGDLPRRTCRPYVKCIDCGTIKTVMPENTSTKC